MLSPCMDAGAGKRLQTPGTDSNSGVCPPWCPGHLFGQGRVKSYIINMFVTENTDNFEALMILSLNGDQLMAQARYEMEKLEDEIYESAKPMAFFTM